MSAQSCNSSRLSFSIPLDPVQTRSSSGVKRNDCDSPTASPSELKKRMLTPPRSEISIENDVDTASPRTDASWPSDEDLNEISLGVKLAGSSSSSQTKNLTKQTDAALSAQGLSADAIKKLKAQRRREQVRAASRRCRYRQRKETEDLRTKVFQLEEYIAHTLQSHEWERRQQNQRILELQQENDLLTQQLALANVREGSICSANSSDLEPTPLNSPIKLEDDTLPDDLVRCITNDVPQQWSRELVLHAVDDTTRQLVAMLESQVQPVKSPVIFGWQFDFWAEGDKYYARNRKFFPGVSALELGKRMQTVDPQRYMETFPEVQKMEILQMFDENVNVMRVVKALPGKALTQAVLARFLATSAPPAGSTSRWVYADRTIDEPSDGEYELENECNGYIFEDTVQKLKDGSIVEGCIAQGVGAFESGGLECSVLLEQLAQAFSSVVIRWESLFINDFIPDDADGFVDMVLDL
ncbi:hypothetical protein PHYBOEH_003547 [Phytophthora boehmeriae]|uniref:BZIP domain-containing protein n=1 Tax=Phytophthora boehmeriae TaxID=109152 RepID=A0A8T1XDD5_9STRA|nr:hypothetical protein PHYBOEH_003547 [Phytophthora boehmeriae]